MFAHHQESDAAFWATARLDRDGQQWRTLLQAGEGLTKGLEDTAMAEEIGWLAIEAASGGAAVTDHFVFGTAGGIDDDLSTVALPGFADPSAVLGGVIHGLSSFKGPDPAFSRGDGLTGGGINLFVQEETTGDRETDHVEEDVAWLAFSDAVTGGPIHGTALL